MRSPEDDDEDLWEFEYNRDESSDEELEKTPRRTRRTAKPERYVTQATRLEDNVTLKLGDSIKMHCERNKDANIAIICEFKMSDDRDCMRAKIVWMMRPEDVNLRGNSPRELYATFYTDWTDLNAIDGKCQLVSKRKFDELYNNTALKMRKGTKKTPLNVPEFQDIYYCARAVEQRFKQVEKIDFDKLYRGVDTPMDKYVETVAEVVGRISAATVAPKTPQKNKKRKTMVEANSVVDDSDADMNYSGGDSSSSDDEPEYDEEDEQLERLKRRKLANKMGSLTPSPRKKNQVSTTPSLPSRIKNITNQEPSSPYKQAQQTLHVAAVPDSLPCREEEFSQIYMAIEGAIHSGSGSTVYVSGIPGTGKTATVREVVNGLRAQVDNGELPDFQFVEINGMKVINPQDAYVILWNNMTKTKNKSISAQAAAKSLEREFNTPSPRRTPIVVLMDELDQLVTRNQSVMYNFFNWPTLQHSRLIVVAVANTMDLPERTLSNKISSRLGLTRIQFATYTAQQLETIIKSRLEANTVMSERSIKFASRALARVGDARRALDICRRAVELAESDEAQVDIPHIKAAQKEMTEMPMVQYIMGLSIAAKVFLCAVLARLRRGGIGQALMSDVLRETRHLISLNAQSGDKESISSDKLLSILFTGTRMNGVNNAVTELVEAGVLAQQSTKGETTGSVQLAIGVDDVTTALKNDVNVRGMI